MIDATQTQIAPAATPENSRHSRKVFHMRFDDDDRMAGSIPVWESRRTAKEKVEEKLEIAANGSNETFESALAYAAPQTPNAGEPEEFGFGDLIDMVNPLQHIPIVSHIYRSMTGDTIKPVAQIIGGGVYGGFVGAAGSLANVIVEYETGKDVAGNVLALVTEGDKPSYRTMPDDPESRLNRALEDSEETVRQNLPGTALSYADLGYGKRAVYEHVAAADGRTAGTMVRRYTEVAPPDNAVAREPITKVAFSENHRRAVYND